MKNFNRESRFGRRTSRSDEPRFGRIDSGSSERRPLEMHDATCDKCGKRCQVPFRPIRDKPVFCSDCFRKGENSESRRPSQDSYKPDQYKKEFEQINEKLNKIMKSLKIY